MATGDSLRPTGIDLPLTPVNRTLLLFKASLVLTLFNLLAAFYSMAEILESLILFYSAYAELLRLEISERSTSSVW